MERQVFDLILKENEITWQSLLMELVKTEGMDPWNINISKIAQSYIATVRRMKEANLRLSGKVVLASAILLHIKSKHLVGKDLEELDRLFANSEDTYDEEEFDEINLLEPLHKKQRPRPRVYPRMPQPRSRKVSITDLVNTLENAMETKQRMMKKRISRAVPQIKGKNSVDISSLIVNVYKRIQNFFKKRKKLTFSQLIPSTRKKDKIYTFIPLLHLYNERKINIDQKETFGEIDITLLKK